MAVLTILRGQELGWVCLASCGTDVTLNAIVLYWVTASRARAHPGAPIANFNRKYALAAAARIAARFPQNPQDAAALHAEFGLPDTAGKARSAADAPDNPRR